MTHSQFQSSRLDVDKNFRVVPNHWVFDSRISPSALRVLLYIHLQSPEWLSSPDQIRKALATTIDGTDRQRPMGKDAFQAAVRNLVTVGYLVVEQRRESGQYAANRYRVREPGRAPEHPVSASFPPEPDFPATVEKASPEPVDNLPELGPEPVSNSPEPVSPWPVSPEPENPALKQEEINKKKKSSSVTDVTTEPVDNSPPAAQPSLDDDDDSELSAAVRAIDQELKAIHPKLSHRALYDRLQQGGKVDIEVIDVVHAALTIVNRSRRPIADPVAYVGSSIELDPGAWILARPRTHDPGRDRASPCDRGEHSWTGPYHEYCRRCDTFREGWQDARDAAMAELDARRGVLT